MTALPADCRCLACRPRRALASCAADPARGRRRAAHQALIGNFRNLYEGVEQLGRPSYRSKEEARLIWDILWVLEFYSPDPGRESNPSEWNNDAAVLAEVSAATRPGASGSPLARP